MYQMLELMLADNREIDIPSNSVVIVEEVAKGFYENFPDARVRLRYAVGKDLRQAILSTKYEDVIFEMGITANPQGWLKLERDTGERLALLARSIIGRMAMEEGTQITVMIGELPEEFTVKQSRREIKKWTERALGGPVAQPEVIEGE